MRRVGWIRVLLILLIVVVSVSSLAFQKIDLSFLGLGLQRGSDAILGMKLGLDLQGGSLLIYQARGTKQISIAFRAPVEVDAVSSVLTRLGKTDAVIELTGDRDVTIAVETLTKEERDADGNIVVIAGEQAIRQALEAQLGLLASFEVSDIPADVTTEQMEGVMDTITRRINPFGISEPEIQLMDQNRVLVQLPGVRDVDEIKRLIGQTARLEIMERTCLSSESIILPDGQIIDSCDLPENHVDKEIDLTGDHLDRAFAGTHPQTGLPVVNIQFNSEGGRTFAELTSRLAASYATGSPDRFVFFLDDEEIIDPVAQQPILGGSAFIEGPTFTADRVRTIAIQLESGILPTPIEDVLQEQVDPTLGSELLQKSLVAGIAGLGLVLLFMALYYRTAGFVATMALVIYTAAVLTIFKLVPITLTLSGIAGFILSIGMAVDANILIFERMKEELRLGRTLASAIEIGFNRAWPAIRDSNVSTLITCAVLIWFGQRLGTTVLSGFGTTLAIGVSMSMFSAIFVTKSLLNLLGFSPFGRKRSWFTPESLPAPSRPAAAGAAAEERE